MNSKYSNTFQIFGIPLILSVILFLIEKQFGGLLFHTVAELFSIIVGILLFTVVWNTRKFLQNYYLLFIGIGYFWIALLDLLHTFSYPGMPFFGVTDINFTIRFWIYTRFLEAIVLLVVPIYLFRQINEKLVLLIFSVIFLVLSTVALSFEQPLFFEAGKGLTSIKIYSEYVIITLLALAALRLWQSRQDVYPKVLKLMLLSVLFTIFAEFSFTTYVSAFGFSNQLGHIFKLFSFWLIYIAIIQTTLTSPYSLMSKAAHSYEVIPNPALIVNSVGVIVQANKAAKVHYDFTIGLGQHVHDVSHPQEIDQADCVICRSLQKGDNIKPQLLQFKQHQQWRLVSLTDIDQDDDKIFIQVSSDVTEQIQMKHDLQLSDQVFNHISEAILVTDESKNIIRVNKAFETITGYCEEDVIGKNPRLLSSGRQSAAFYKNMWKSINETGSWHGEIWNRHKNGSVLPMLSSVTKIKDSASDVIYYVGAFSDISLMKGVEEQLEYVSHYDPLTNLPNKLLFDNILSTSMRHHNRTKDQMALLYIGLDNFSHINQRLGRTIGDAVMLSVAERFKEELREHDTVARYTGDEFLILIEDVKLLSDVSFIAEKILSSLVAPIYYQKEIPVYVSASTGIALYPNDADQVDELIQRANSAMLEVKKQDKNGYSFYTQRDDDASSRRLLVESQLRTAIQNKELYVVYQPKVDANTQKTVGAEALVRWNNKVLGEVYPDEFIPLAEAIGIIKPLTEFVLTQALMDFKQWRHQFSSKLTVAVNFSTKQFNKQGVLNSIDRSLEQFDLPNSALEIEITEGLLLDQSEYVLELLNKITDSGTKISIDDFGTGYSSLSYLKKYPIHTVKIDKAFIDGVADEEESRVLVKTIILMAHGLGMEVVAEGIETKDQLDYYKSQDGDLVQGYYYSKPLRSDDFEAYLKNTKVI